MREAAIGAGVRTPPPMGRNAELPDYVWDLLTKAMEDRTVVPCRIIRECAGGAVVEVMGSRGFLPNFHSSVGHVPDEWDPAASVGEVHPVRIIEVVPGNEIVVSRRAALIDDDAWSRVQAAFESRATVQATVVKSLKNGVLVNVLGAEGYLAEIGISRDLRRNGIHRLIGQDVELKIVRVQDIQRRVVVSQRASQVSDHAWQRVLTAFRSESVLIGRIEEILSRGALVDLFGIEALLPFTPIRHRYLRHDWSPADHLGEDVEVRVTAVDSDSRGVLVSRGAALVDNDTWDAVKGAFNLRRPTGVTVMLVTEGGLGVDLLGVDALLPWNQFADDMPYDRPEDYVGTSFDVRITAVDPRHRSAVVSCRALLHDPESESREQLLRELLPGQVREGTVKNITDYGVFVDLGGIDALLHQSELAWYRVGHPSDYVRVGESIDVKVLAVDTERVRVSVGRKQLLPDPWRSVPSKYPIGQRVIAKVHKITAYGIMVALEEGVIGLAHRTNLEWANYWSSERETLVEGDELEVVVLGVDVNGRRISLGRRQLTADPWDLGQAKYLPGVRVVGRVVSIKHYGAFVRVEPDMDGLLHTHDMTWTKPETAVIDGLSVDDELEMVVLSYDCFRRRLGLGLKQVTEVIPPNYEYEDDIEGRSPFGAGRGGTDGNADGLEASR